MKRSISLLTLSLVMILLAAACGGGSGGNKRTFERNPVNDLIRDMFDASSFSILLYDMDVQGNIVKHYVHKYRVIKEVDSVVTEETTDWLEVPEDYFFQNEQNLGMELAAKGPDGKISKTPSPAGYNNYVGNPRYGQWQTNSSGESFWSFYGKYALLSSLLNLGARPAYRGYYDDYYTNYRGSRPYYGPNSPSGRSTYGTNSDYARQTRPNFYERRANKGGFTRSSSRSSSSTRSSSRTSRSSSRYNSRSSSRSRGSSSGK